GTYTRHHNPFVLLSDVANNSAERQHIQPFSQFASDLASGHLTDYVYLVPDSCDDGHDCADATVDAWLRTNIDPLIKSALFANSLLLITFDESQTWLSGSDYGGRIATVLVGPHVKRGYQGTTHYNHNATLRVTLEKLGINSWPGTAAGAPSMADFFQP